jgi:tetratricopeptide (TPR) repeat protein
MAVTHRSPLYSSEFFYAESWALVHFLIYGPGMEGGKKLDRFFALLQQGVEQRKAFQQAFGEPKELDKAFAGYTWIGSTTGGDGTVGQSFTATVLRNTPQIDEKEFAIRTISLAETDAELASYHLWIRDLEGARALTEQALKNDPKLARAHENMGFLDFADGKDAEAASEFAQAYTLDSKLYLSLFANTMMSPLSASHEVADINRFGAALGKVLQINPQFAPAYTQLAWLALRENDLDSAILLSRKAEEMEPSLAGYHLLSGQILRRMGKSSDAAKFVSDRWVGPDHNEAVELWNSVPAEQRPAGVVAFEPAPKDTQVVEGKLKSVACADKDQDWALVLDQGGSLLTFYRKSGFATGFSTRSGMEGTTLTCATIWRACAPSCITTPR